LVLLRAAAVSRCDIDKIFETIMGPGCDGRVTPELMVFANANMTNSSIGNGMVPLGDPDRGNCARYICKIDDR
jgi:hypothetical protein